MGSCQSRGTAAFLCSLLSTDGKAELRIPLHRFLQPLFQGDITSLPDRRRIVAQLAVYIFAAGVDQRDPEGFVRWQRQDLSLIFQQDH